MGSQSKESFVACVIFVIIFVVYLKCLHPSLPGGDAGELIVAAHESGVAHPPGYPLFTLLAKLFMSGIPVGCIAWRVNLLSALCGAACGCVVYLLVYRLTQSHEASLLGTCTFSFSRLAWMWSVSAEVFSLNNLLVSALMLAAVEFDAAAEESLVKLSLSGSFLCGLCLSNQHTSVVYMVVIVPWALYKLVKNQLLTLPVLFKLAVTFVCGLSPYIYLPVSAHLHVARWTWGDQRTLRGFLTHLLRVEYGTWDLLKGHSGQGFKTGFIFYLRHVVSDLSYWTATLGVLSFISIYYRYTKSRSTVVAVMYIMLVVYLVFFCWRANLDIQNPLFFRVVERFWMQSDLVVVVLASVTFSDVCRLVSSIWKFDRFRLDLVLALPLIASCVTNWQQWELCDQSNNFVVRDFAVQSLQAFPPESIVLTKGDLPSNSFRYFHLCENIRPDLTVFDQEVLTYEWSLPMTRDFYPGITFPGDVLQTYVGLRADNKMAFRFKDMIDANYRSHPIFACIGVQEHEPSWKKSYTLWPFGTCWQIIKRDMVLNVSLWTNATTGIADQWKYPWSSSNNGSWEDVANSEMWRAKTSTAFFYLELATSMPDGQREAIQLLMESYQLFTRAIEKEHSVPAFWHRNYAIVCERLLRASTPLDQMMLLEKTIYHFKEYVLQVPDDADSNNIKHAVATLQEYMISLKKFKQNTTS